MKTGELPKYLNSEQLAGQLAVSQPTIMDWYSRGVIPAVIAEGKVIRFDLPQVQKALLKRAMENREKYRVNKARSL